MSKFVTRSSAAKFLGLTIQTLMSWEKRKTNVQPLEKSGGRIWYDMEELEAYKKKNGYSNSKKNNFSKMKTKVKKEKEKRVKTLDKELDKYLKEEEKDWEEVDKTDKTLHATVTEEYKKDLKKSIYQQQLEIYMDEIHAIYIKLATELFGKIKHSCECEIIRAMDFHKNTSDKVRMEYETDSYSSYTTSELKALKAVIEKKIKLKEDQNN